MTEEERNELKRLDPAYLQGRIDALESLLFSLIDAQPDIVLRKLANQNTWCRERLAITLDQNSAYRSWDMAERSWHPMDEPPAIKKNADGQNATFEATDELFAEVWESREDGTCFALIATTPKGQALQKKVDAAIARGEDPAEVYLAD